MVLAPALQACARTLTPGAPASQPPTAASATGAPESTSLSAAPPTATPPATLTSPPTATAALTAAPRATATVAPGNSLPGQVALVNTADRAGGVGRALDLLGVNPVTGRHVLLKPNFNSADPTPGSTHPDALRALINRLWEMGARAITVVDRSGMGNTRAVMEQLGVFALAAELGFEVVVLDELADADWVLQRVPGQHWQAGFAVPRRLLEAECVVQTCNLKTHRYGGHFTLSLKNSVGLAAKHFGGYNYM